MKAVHFGAGNIGRGFIGLVLHQADYEVVFADVNAELIARLSAAGRYTVHEVGEGARDLTVDRIRALDSRADEIGVRNEIATADVVTCAVGPTVLRFIAPVIADALRERSELAPPVAVMACENAVNATDLLRDAIADAVPPGEWPAVAARAVFANTAVDRIVPQQEPDAGLDVTVETFFEWVVERGPFGGNEPPIPAAHFVDDLAPYIDRKLFTVNTGHATIAYLGHSAGYPTISAALADRTIAAEVAGVLQETAEHLAATHHLDPAELADYGRGILTRFRNPHLTDTPARVGRQPLRKLGRHERFIAPAAGLAERGRPVAHLLAAIGAALRFDNPDDDESMRMRRMLAELSPESFVAEVTGIEPAHPLFGSLTTVVSQEKVS